MPGWQGYADRKFANGLGRRAEQGCCCDCGKTLLDPTALVCPDCRRKPERQTAAFAEAEGRHRDRMQQYFSHGA